MHFLESYIPNVRENLVYTFIEAEQQTVQETIRLSIANELIEKYQFACTCDDEEEEVYVFMSDRDRPYYASLFSDEISTAIRLIGLFKGVKLNDDDVRKISKYLEDFFLENGDCIEYIEEPVQSVEADE